MLAHLGKFVAALALMVLGLAQPLAGPLPVWTFDVDVRVTREVMEAHGGLAAVKGKISRQFADVSRAFNEAEAFNGVIEFRPTSISELQIDPASAVYGLRSTNSFQLIYDNSRFAPGYYPDAHAVFFGWPESYAGGPFGFAATRCLTHEFGHARGAVDLYGLHAASRHEASAPLAFAQETSVMNDPYSTDLWDEHSRNVINLAGSACRVDHGILTNAFPRTILIRALDLEGKALPGAAVRALSGSVVLRGGGPKRAGSRASG